MSLTDINLRERQFHDDLQSQSEGRKQNIFYKALSAMFKDFNNILNKNIKDKKILDFGCGIGSITEKVSLYSPSQIVGIDISEVSINKAKNNAKKKGLNIQYSVDNCEKSKLESNSFDLIYGSAILHHLNLHSCLKEINRLLKKDGMMVFMEPLGTNPLINLYRKFTPNDRSQDEHPFIKKDFELMKNVYSKVDVEYYGFLTLIFFIFYRNPEKSFFFKFLNSIDKLLFKISIFKKLAWSVLIVCKKS